jgi:histidine triad (HIT) family protein
MPSYKIYEDGLFLVILDRFPRCPGHMLILPKKHAANLFDLPADAAGALVPLAQKLAKKMHEALGFQGLNLLQNNGEAAGQVINHFHMHLIPRYNNDAIVMKWTMENPSDEDFKRVLGRIKL